MNYLRTPPEFDYDLWRTDDGKYFARVKCTGEVTEVDPAVMRFLRAEEKALRRSISSIENPTLSLDTEAMQNTAADRSSTTSRNSIDSLLNKICIEEIRTSLTEIQKEIFDTVLVGGMGCREYARLKELHHKTVEEQILSIRKIFQKIF